VDAVVFRPKVQTLLTLVLTTSARPIVTHLLLAIELLFLKIVFRVEYSSEYSIDYLSTH